MAKSQEYLREIALHVDSIYVGALRDAADRLDRLEKWIKEWSEHKPSYGDPWVECPMCRGEFHDNAREILNT